MVRQGRCLRVELAEAPCAFSDVTQVLGDADVNVDGFAAHAQGRRAYLAVEDAKRARHVLHEQSIEAETRPMVAATLTSRPGELARAMDLLAESGVDVEASFLVVAPWGPSIQVGFATDQPDSAVEVLAELEDG